MKISKHSYPIYHFQLQNEIHVCLGIPNIDEDIFMIRDVKSWDNILRANVLLEDIFLRLQSFLPDGRFETDDFESAVLKVNDHLVAIHDSLEGTVGYFEVLEKLEFVEQMFNDMIETATNLKDSDFLGSPAEHLVYCVTELNARLLTLFNSRGIPNIRMNGYSHKLSRFGVLKDIWEKEFKSFPEIPLKLRMKFMNNIFKANKTLKVLQSHLLKNGRINAI
ncbi:hypothetical protein JCM33374_g4466 [Metschnikowia sp. JCM 33374]|nr:hypothetical protein JCM33374_g4466 [Metschnikowia sp. JCM 33374]